MADEQRREEFEQRIRAEARLYEEAMTILAGGPGIVAREHLQILHTMLETFKEQNQRLGSALVALLQQHGAPSMKVGGPAFQQAVRSGLTAYAQPQADGSCVVRAVPVTSPIVQQPRSVM